jgi:hypothetical protein
MPEDAAANLLFSKTPTSKVKTDLWLSLNLLRNGQERTYKRTSNLIDKWHHLLGSNFAGVVNWGRSRCF